MLESNCRAIIAERLQPLSLHLRQRQQGTVAKVASRMHVALLAVAVILLHWPDANLPRRCITGFQSLGMLEPTRVLRQMPRIPPVQLDELLAGGPAAFTALDSCVPTDEAARFLLAESHRDLSRGFAGPLMTKSEGQVGNRSLAAYAAFRDRAGKRQAPPHR